MTHPKPTDSELEAKKYPMPGKIKGVIYGTPEINSILARFEAHILALNGARELYKDGSVAYRKRWDDIRLETATRIMQRDQQRLTAALGKMQTIPLSDYDRTEVKAALIVALGPDNSKTKEKTT